MLVILSNCRICWLAHLKPVAILIKQLKTNASSHQKRQYVFGEQLDRWVRYMYAVLDGELPNS